jgi:hypothetical protein
VVTGALVQLDLFAAIEDAKLEAPTLSIYGSPARGLVARAAEAAAWREEYGRFGYLARSHAWTVHITRPESPTERCQPTVLSADLRCHCDRFDHDREPCCCVGELMYRGACRGCGWEGQPHDEENAAAEDACDHAWPGWAELPVVAGVPEERKKRARWVETVTALYPVGWLEDGGPIRTSRSKSASRHVPGRTPFGGYDLAVVDAGDPTDAERRRS